MGELVHETVRAVIVRLALSVVAVRRPAGGLEVVRLLRVLRLIRVAHEVSCPSISISSLLGAPDFLLARWIREDGLWKSGRRGRELTATVARELISIVIEAEVQLQPV